MTRRLIWLKVLLVLWILTGMLWFGITLPNWAQNTQDNGHVSAAEMNAELPSMIMGKPGSKEIYFSKNENSPLQSFIKNINSEKRNLIITGYYTSKESPEIAQGRAKNFKNILNKYGEFDEILSMRTEQKDNLLLQQGYLYDVIGIKMGDKVIDPSDFVDFSISFNALSDENLSTKELDQEYNKIKVYLDQSEESKVNIILKGPKPQEEINEYRQFVQEVKTRISEKKVPKFRLIGDIRPSETDSFELKITYN